MSEMAFSFLVTDKQTRDQALKVILQNCGDQARAGTPLEVVVRHPKNQRSLEQNKLLHKLCSIASEKMEIAGSSRTAEEWKRIFISGFQTAAAGPSQVLPGIEGEFVSLSASSTSFGVKRMAELIEYIQAYMADQGVFDGGA